LSRSHARQATLAASVELTSANSSTHRRSRGVGEEEATVEGRSEDDCVRDGLVEIGVVDLVAAEEFGPVDGDLVAGRGRGGVGGAEDAHAGEVSVEAGRGGRGCVGRAARGAHAGRDGSRGGRAGADSGGGSRASAMTSSARRGRWEHRAEETIPIVR
jgi:hypothetical protein